MIQQMDEGIGKVLDALDAHGLAEDTLVVFTSDNGGERFSDNWPFVGQKMDLLEGGIRVPLIARWPARVKPGGTSTTPVMSMDWCPTMLEAAEVAPHPDYPLDGISLLPLFADPAWDPGRRLYWRMLHRRQAAMRDGVWKYLAMDGHEYLFDLSRDERERANRAGLEPERLSQMRKAWQHWEAQFPPIPAEATATLVFGESDLPRASH